MNRTANLLTAAALVLTATVALAGMTLTADRRALVVNCSTLGGERAYSGVIDLAHGRLTVIPDDATGTALDCDRPLPRITARNLGGAVLWRRCRQLSTEGWTDTLPLALPSGWSS